MMKKLGLSIAGISLLAMGCAVENQEYNVDGFSERNNVERNRDFDFERDGSPNVNRDSVVVRDGAVFTNTGGFNVNGSAQDIYSYGDTDFLNADLTRTEADSAMALVYVTDLDHPVFTEVGRTTTFRNGQPVATSEGIEEGNPSLSLTACAGPDQGNWEVDVPVDEVEVTVEETDEGETVLVMESDTMDVEMELDLQ